MAEAGSTILSEGTHSPHLYTVLSGWAFRFKSLPDGRRQILNYLLPGDLLGLQGSIMGEMEHSVEALTPMVLCVFQRDKLDDLFEGYPGLVVQGPLTASLLLDLCARELGPDPLASFAFRARTPAFAGEAIYLVGRRDGSEVELAALGDDGRTIISATATARS